MAISRRSFLRASSAAMAVSSLSSVFPKQALASPRELDELVAYDALGMAELIKKGELSQTEVVEIIIRRIEALEPILNVITTKTYARARQRASSIPADSTFSGVPILLKDMIDVGGVRRTDGSRLMLTNVPAKNVKYIDAVEAAGMNILGMTNVPEFAQLGLVTNNTAFGQTLNPWDLSKSALGSSGGSAAAVAAGIVPMAHGTDGGGSNRLPASANGVFGMKPSRGRMLSGEVEGGHSRFKTNQAISRTVRDSAALFNETEDKSGAAFEPVGMVAGPSTKRLKVGLALELKGGMPVEKEVRDAILSAASLLEDLGHTVIEIDYPVDRQEYFRAYTNAFLRRFGFIDNMARSLTGLSSAESGLLDPFTASMSGYGASITDEQEAAGLAYLARVPRLFAKVFDRVDIILSPVMPVVSIEADALKPQDSFNSLTREFLENRMGYTAPSNVAGNPAMSVPLNWGAESGLPIGSMFQAATGNDRMLYQLAYELEQAKPWKDRWAPYSVNYIPV
ncbi:MAG: amidase family protein [Halieaceae bacterium]